MKRVAYRVGYPGWKFIAMLGIPLKLVVKVLYDPSKGYFVAFSDDFNPESSIAAEEKSWNALVIEVYSQIEEAIEFIFKGNRPRLLNIKPLFNQC